jgi:hypothetical protein
MFSLKNVQFSKHFLVNSANENVNLLWEIVPGCVFIDLQNSKVTHSHSLWPAQSIKKWHVDGVG